jgi:transposase
MKYSKEIVDKICKLVENGVFNKDAAEAVGVSETTFYRWQQEKKEFRESLKKAEANRKKNFVLAITKAANTTWQAAAWYLERVYNTEFAKREIKKHEGKVEVEESSKELDEAVEAAYEKLKENIQKPDSGEIEGK